MVAAAARLMQSLEFPDNVRLHIDNCKTGGKQSLDLCHRAPIAIRALVTVAVTRVRRAQG